MASSSKKRDVYEELISPLERFSWTEDDAVTRRRRRGTRVSRIAVPAGVVSAIAFALVLYQGRMIAFGPLATAASSVSTSTW